MNARLAVLAAVLFVPSVSSAADLPVSYLVEEKPLKAAVLGTPFAFELYSNNTCTTLVQSVPVNVENVTVLSKLKQMTPKGDAKLPNTVEMRTTLAGATAATPLFLKVTGTGVTPVGGACQAQAAGGGSATPALPRTVFVPADGLPAANGAALLAAAAGITGDVDRPTTLQLDDGAYDIGSTTLALSGIVLAGRSAEHTLITAGGHAALTDTTGGAVRTDSNVRDIKIAVNGGGAAYGAAIVFVGFGTISNVTVEVANAQNSYGVWNVFGNITLREVTVNVNGTGPAVALRNDWTGFGANARVLESKLVADSSEITQGDGIASDGGNVRASNSTIAGAFHYAKANAGSASFRLRDCGLSGSAEGSVTCINSNTSINAYPSTCPGDYWTVTFD